MNEEKRNIKLLRSVKQPKYKIMYGELKRKHDELELRFKELTRKYEQLSMIALKENITFDAYQIDGVAIPRQIIAWSIEYGVPWECFKCDIHGKWLVELDSSFPYHWCGCMCEDCNA